MVSKIKDLGNVILQKSQAHKHTEVLALWSQFFHTFPTHHNPDVRVCLGVLAACSSAQNAQACEQVYIASRGSKFLGQHVVFNTSLIRALQRCKRPGKALELWAELNKREGTAPITWDRVAFVCILSACADVGRSALATGESVRKLISLEDLRHDNKLLASLLNMHVKCGRPEAAIQLAEDLWAWNQGICGDKYTLTCLLSACIQVPPALDLVVRVHQFIASASIGFDNKLFSVLMLAYHQCSAFNEAVDLWWSANGRALASEEDCCIVLLSCVHASVASSNALTICTSVRERIHEIEPSVRVFLHLIATCHKCDRPDLLLSAWREMGKIGGTTDIVALRLVLHACATLASSDSMSVAQQLFSGSGSSRGQLFDAMLRVFIGCQQPQLAVQFWHDEIQPTTCSNKHTIVLVLQACAATTNLGEVNSLHSSVISQSAELQQNVHILSSLMKAYIQCNQPALAIAVYQRARKDSVALDLVGVTCTLQAFAKFGSSSLIQDAEELIKELQPSTMDNRLFSGVLHMYTKCGVPERALRYFSTITETNPGLIDSASVTTALSACADLSSEDSLAAGERIISLARKSNVKRDLLFENTCMSLYTQCGRPHVALQIWNSIQEHYTPSPVSYVCALAACAACGSSELNTGRNIHSRMPQHMLHDHTIINALMTMYLRCGEPKSALDMWHFMLKSGINHNPTIYFNVLRTCATIGTPAALAVGMAVHRLIPKETLLQNEMLQNALISMYTYCGEPRQAISTWEELTPSRTTSNEFIRTSVFTASYRQAVVPASVKHLLEATVTDIENGVVSNETLETAVVNVYAKCGDINRSKLLFESIYKRRGTPSINMWNAMINAFAKHRDGVGARDYFDRLRRSPVKPDSITFVVLLNACAHSSLVTECLQYFQLMQSEFNIQTPSFPLTFLHLPHKLSYFYLLLRGIVPTIEHQCCVIDALARNGQLLQAERFIEDNIPSKNQNIVLWMTLLGSCRSQVFTAAKKMEFVTLAERVYKKITVFDSRHGGALVTLGNIYEAAGLFTLAKAVRKTMQTEGIEKIPGKSWLLGHDGKYHSFVANDHSHPQIKEIHAKWEELSQLIQYKPDLRWVLQNETVQQKKIRLCRHSEKLALCFALLSTPKTETISIIKNLRMCGDCHATTAIISQAVGHRIVVRDSKSFHHFENGACSCGGKY